jgi:conjugal transfer pilus assembly protein TraW
MSSSDPHTYHPVGWRRRVRVALACAALVGLSQTATADHLGVIGPVYEIAEPNLLEVILAKLRHAESAGVLARLQQDAQRNARRAIEEPEPVPSVTRTTRARSFFHDPSIVVPHAITDADGKVIVAPGTRVNPLDTVSLSKSLLFFDARDPNQVKRARGLLDQQQGRVKLILTGGSYLELMRRWQVPVFYDQNGALVAKLGIRQVPAMVSQDGRRLRIDELL